MKFCALGCHFHPSYWSTLPPSYLKDWGVVILGPPPKNILYEIKYGKFRGDMIGFGIVSDRIIDALKRANATGCKPYPVKIVMRGRSVVGYQGLHVFGRGGPFDPIRSSAKYGPAGGLIAHRRVVMDESQWDGSDVFTIPGLGMSIYVVERIARILRRMDLKNVSIRAASRCSLP